MNKMVEHIVGQCYECQATTKEHRHEPLKMTEIPDKPRQIVLVDFDGPFPDGHYTIIDFSEVDIRKSDNSPRPLV